MLDSIELLSWATVLYVLTPRTPRMPNYLATAAALFVVVLFAVAVLAMTVGNYAAAGVLFFSASIVIYFREKRLVGG